MEWCFQGNTESTKHSGKHNQFFQYNVHLYFYLFCNIIALRYKKGDLYFDIKSFGIWKSSVGNNIWNLNFIIRRYITIMMLVVFLCKPESLYANDLEKDTLECITPLELTSKCDLVMNHSTLYVMAIIFFVLLFLNTRQVRMKSRLCICTLNSVRQLWWKDIHIIPWK